MRIGIIGAGAIGGWLGVSLAAAGHDVSALARGATLAALRDRPWKMQGQGRDVAARVHASDDTAELGVQDLLFLTVKGPALPGLVPALTKMIGPDTLVVPAMNGVPWWFLQEAPEADLRRPLDAVDPGGVLSRAIAPDRIIGSVVYTAASTTVPGEVTLKSGNRILLGEPFGASDHRVGPIVEAMKAAGMDAVHSPQIRYDIWYKLWGNMTINPISALTGAMTDRILDDPLLTQFVLAVMSEAQAIGRRIGIDIKERGEDRNDVTRSWGGFKTSMLQDAEAGRPIELDQLVGAPREIASRLGMPTPSLDALLGLTRVFARQHGLYPQVADLSANAA